MTGLQLDVATTATVATGATVTPSCFGLAAAAAKAATSGVTAAVAAGIGARGHATI